MKQYIRPFLTAILLVMAHFSIAQELFSPAKPSPKYEVRAVWLTTLSGLDWPKTKATSAAKREQQKQELCRILDQLKAAKINTVLMQTRIRGAVIYPSKIEPWDVCLTGQFDKDPGYDPLAFAIEETHRRGMELHAWVVTVPCFKIKDAAKMGSKSLLKTHPELLKKHNDMYYLDPGLPGSDDYLVNICKEIVSRYDVDGIHFDYIRYPENAEGFPDGATFKKYGKNGKKGDWRRNNITRMVSKAHKAIKTLKPWVRLSCSPVGKFKDMRRFSARGWNAYSAVYQDAQGWLRDGIMDMLCPMMYFQGDHFYPFAADWQENSYGRTIVPGLGIYFLSPREKDWNLGVIQRELCYLREQGLQGQAYFRSQFLTENTKGLYDYVKTAYYPYPALLPPMTWESSTPPAAPKVRKERTGPTTGCLKWEPVKDCRYVVYASKQQPVDTSNPANIVTVTPVCEYSYNLLTSTLLGLHFTVTALDRFGNESQQTENEKSHNHE
ncbi:MAG: family 10 glycosylhydrolase [Bacteroidaceae bacterium]|nr:family 10 glycosylhydrolase [Bacteroidaceae bacterium]